MALFESIRDVAFPLGVVVNRHHEYVKVEGGPISPGAIVLSTATGEIYRVEWVDVSSNRAHCRRIVRAIDPMLAHCVETTEDVGQHNLHLSDAYRKYEYHWLRRMDVASRMRASPETPGSHLAPQVVQDNAVDSRVLAFGSLPAHALSGDAFAMDRHQSSPVMQKRLQRHGARNSFASGSESDSDDERLQRELQRLSEAGEADAAVIRDFESLFGTLEATKSKLKDLAPRIVVSKNVCFLTDYCCDIKAGVLRPTTTFKFLLWMDLAFVVALRDLFEYYDLAAKQEVDTWVSFRNSIASDYLHPGRTGTLPHRQPRLGALDIISSCFGHEETGAGTMAESLLADDEPASPQPSVPQRCSCCGETTTAYQARLGLDETVVVQM
jgi:hypothetical protein